ncbi:TPA: DEAD/DEAH box helicase family protein [Bacillus wiedmannii]|nr:DEAD/DEAH box helicase family protein [Bacillus wiedmannii]
MSNELLHSRIENRFNDIFENPPEVPEYILENLNHKLRPYQLEAIRHYIYTQGSEVGEDYFNHLLFHMATGSGKTVILAATILYLYKEKNMQDFIFFVNSEAIINKTIDNLTNVNSQKYLFNTKGIVIEGKRVSIKLVEVFPENKDKNTIYLKLTTIQKLHLDLSFPKENALSYEDLTIGSICLLADEAHHINAYTRSDKKKLSKREFEEKTWENTVQKILMSNMNNKLIEFTATIDLNNESLFNKYRDKIVFQYDLKKFMKDGYSKNVVLLKANQNDDEKFFNSMLLSQYRKYIANENGIELKPIILFKSNKIEQSMKANSKFVDMINQLDIDTLSKKIYNGRKIYSGTDTILERMFEYYSTKNLAQLLSNLKWDFDSLNILNANDKNFISEKNSILLNSLENPENPIRVIFAVAKLNEGWDVLNLFDIVRLSEDTPITKAITDSEAQLIGRGARFNPYRLDGELIRTRKFDFSVSNLKLLETLHYHTINDSAYIKNLEKSLEAANVEFYSDSYQRLEAKVKKSFRKTDFFNNGKIYINKVVPTSKQDYTSLKDYNVSSQYIYVWESSSEQFLGTKNVEFIQYENFKIDISKVILKKAMRLRPFFRFNVLSEYIPAIKSIDEFIESENFLAGIEMNVSLPKNIPLELINNEEKLKIATGFLENLETMIKNNYRKEKGLPIFEAKNVSDIIDDYVIELNTSSKNYSNLIKVRNMSKQDWFIYDVALVNQLEENLIEFIFNHIEKLTIKYKDVYLIRNERKVKLTEFEGTRGFMPDFILYLKDANFSYYVFIEPKGLHLIEKDQWKQKMLEEMNLRADIEIIGENKDVRILGLKFYNNQDSNYKEFVDDFNSKVLL